MKHRNQDTREFLRQFAARYTVDQVIAALEGLRSLKVLVLGDIIIDEYHYCRAVGKSSKSATLTAKYISEERHAGGVLAVANHIAGFVDTVHLVTYIGEPREDEAFVRDHLKPTVVPHLIADPGRPMAIKRRYVDPFQVSKIFEIMWLDDGATVPRNEAQCLTETERLLPGCDMALVSDFGHGALTPPLVDMLTGSEAYLSVNTQANSANFGYNVITKYPRCDYFSIDEEEIRLANHDRHGDICELLDRTARQQNCRVAAVTRGSRGSLTWSDAGPTVTTPVLSAEVVDSVGAGDAYLSITSLCAKMGYAPDLIGFIGNCVGALAVTIIGNRESVEPAALFEYIRELY